jgi:hypothetical protein
MVGMVEAPKPEVLYDFLGRLITRVGRLSFGVDGVTRMRRINKQLF